MRFGRRRSDPSRLGSQSFETRPELDWKLPAFDPTPRVLALGPGSTSEPDPVEHRLRGLEDRFRQVLLSQERLVAQYEQLTSDVLARRQEALETQHRISRRLDDLTVRITALELRPDPSGLTARVEELATRVDRSAAPHDHPVISQRLDQLALTSDQMTPRSDHRTVVDALAAREESDHDARLSYERHFEDLDSGFAEQRQAIEEFLVRLESLDARVQTMARPVKARKTAATATKTASTSRRVGAGAAGVLDETATGANEPTPQTPEPGSA
jgi:hypothetical protein